MNDKTRTLYHKLVELNRRAPGVLATVTALAPDAGAYRQAMTGFERWLRALHEAEQAGSVKAAADAGEAEKPAKPPAPPPPAGLPAEEWELFCRGIERSQPLRALFLGPDDWRFSEAEPREVATLARLADVAPDRAGELNSKDAAF